MPASFSILLSAVARRGRMMSSLLSDADNIYFADTTKQCQITEASTCNDAHTFVVSTSPTADNHVPYNVPFVHVTGAHNQHELFRQKVCSNLFWMSHSSRYSEKQFTEMFSVNEIDAGQCSRLAELQIFISLEGATGATPSWRRRSAPRTAHGHPKLQGLASQIQPRSSQPPCGWCPTV